MQTTIRFAKYHALGNAYIVIEPAEIGAELSADSIRRICDPHYGLGADGILLGPARTAEGQWTLRIFNPDGSEAEKSGNGLRIFARYLWDCGQAGTEPFAIHTAGGEVVARVHAGGQAVTVEMGRVSFDSARIPVAGPRREVVDETLLIEGQTLRYCAATLGNPHAIILLDEVSPALARRLGPKIEVEPRFPNRTNVQFLQVLDRANLRIEIWERGAGYTLASGSSSCAAAAAAYRLGLCDARLAVHMPGGVIHIEIGTDWSVKMSGEVEYIGAGQVVLQSPAWKTSK